jgi:hypothetical protein
VIGHFRNETTDAARVIYDQADLLLADAGTVDGEPNQYGSLLCSLLDYVENHRVRGGRLSRVQWIAAESVALDCDSSLPVTVSAQVPPAPDVGTVLLTLEPVAAGETVAALREAGWNGLVVGGPTLGSPLFARIVDPSEVVFASPYRLPDAEGRDVRFAAKYQALGPHVPNPGPFALTTYETVQSVLDAVEAVVGQGEVLTRRAIAESLIEPPREVAYLYRWTQSGALELIEEHSPASSGQPAR